MSDLSDELSIRDFRLEVNYTAVRLFAQSETRPLSDEFRSASDKLSLLEREEAEFDVRRMENQALVESADDAWDSVMIALRRRLLELSDGSTDAPLYREYFADIPSQVTNLSYAAEIMISKEVEQKLESADVLELRGFVSRLESAREDLEKVIEQRVRLEVEEGRFRNRVALAKEVVNSLRRTTFDELAVLRGGDERFASRFFFSSSPEPPPASGSIAMGRGLSAYSQVSFREVPRPSYSPSHVSSGAERRDSSPGGRR